MTSAARWTADHLPELPGKTIVITGGNGGLGYEAASQLARTGAHVVLACRDLRKAQQAIEAIRSVRPGATLDVMELDLANLASVRAFAEAYRVRHETLDVLCNNAGVMALPYRKTADGFEMQLGTNHLGHFALTGLLLEPLLRTNGARVVNVSSGAHRFGRIRFDDLHWERRYRKWAAYGQSKLANLLFTYELQRKLEAAGSKVMSVGCHPGYAATDLQFAGPRMAGSSVLELGAGLMNRLFAQSAAMGALPILYAVTVSDVRGGDYIGPDGIGEMRGFPKRVRSSARSYNREAARRLWEISEALTGVRYAL
ncbi:MAG: short-chain dehydrogenase [Acidobacteria bacterium RBG_16_68_9]|nr:MAG: short-chain dehydrogenase [Acidobacteria bacterium RBG_16_68_9]